MPQDYSSTDQGSENRSDLMQVASLWEYFCERTAADAKNWYKDKTSAPPLAMIIACAVATIFLMAMKSQVAFVFGALTVAQLFWYILVKSANNSKNLAEALRKISSGSFPAELSETIAKRLRWWNFLIVPQEWTHNSRIYEMQDKFRSRIDHLMGRREYWSSEEGLEIRGKMQKDAHDADLRREEQNKKLKLLQSRGVNVTGLDEQDNTAITESQSYRDPEALSRMISTPTERDKHIIRINHISDPLMKVNEELVFTQAMLLKSEKITKLLDQIERLVPPLQKVSSSNIDSSVREIINVLEQRRKIVAQVNQIPPKRVTQLLNYDLLFTEKDLINE